MSQVSNYTLDIDWEKLIEEGNSYLKTAVNGVNNKKKFNPELIYNIVTLAIEKYFMGFILSHGKMPGNHTLKDLVDCAKEFAQIDDQLVEKMVYLDSFQEICSLDNYSRKTPSEEELKEIIDTGLFIKNFVLERLEAA